MGQKIDLTNQRYGRLVALNPTDKRSASGSIYWLFQCDCGKQKVIDSNQVRMGLVKSCGCLHAPHHGSKTRLFTIWVDMRQRCRPIINNSTKYHGAKGIKVCPEWNDYPTFEKWALENGYKDNLSIDRIDYDGDYEPSNCRWATNKQQNNNKSNNHRVTINGETHNITEWVDKLQIVSSATVFRRVRAGWNIEDALLTPPIPQNQRSHRKMKKMWGEYEKHNSGN
jgi:hypothetical protein